MTMYLRAHKLCLPNLSIPYSSVRTNSILNQEENIFPAKNFASSGEEGQTLNFTFKSQNKYELNANFHSKKHYLS